jgi:hypothetical protein
MLQNVEKAYFLPNHLNVRKKGLKLALAVSLSALFFVGEIIAETSQEPVGVIHESLLLN